MNDYGSERMSEISKLVAEIIDRVNQLADIAIKAEEAKGQPASEQVLQELKDVRTDNDTLAKKLVDIKAIVG
jgi:hypothetical protein